MESAAARASLPVDADGRLDYGGDFFGEKVFLTVSGQLNGALRLCARVCCVLHSKNHRPTTVVLKATARLPYCLCRTATAQTPGEMYASALGNIYTFGPTFRAENSNTSRHLAEFWMIEPELAFADLSDDMACAEAYLKHCVRYILEVARARAVGSRR
jgi:asparaginyl-tRNA synthetase